MHFFFLFLFHTLISVPPSTLKVINQNIAEVLAIFAMNFICAVLGSLEIMDNDRWINRLSPYINVALLKTAGKIEIVLAVLLPVFAIAFALPSYKLTKQLGWTRYKKIGADLAIDSKHLGWSITYLIHSYTNIFCFTEMYRVYQQFLLVVKIDIFTEFLVSLFFVIKGGILTNGTNVSLTWIELVQIAVTALILPMLIAGRYSVSDIIIGLCSRGSAGYEILILGIFLMYRLKMRVTRAWLFSSPSKLLCYFILLLCYI
jgi:hypothetical protein